MSEKELSKEQIARKHELENQVLTLLRGRPGMQLQDLVEILDAKEFLVHVKGGLQFKFKEYVNFLLEQERTTGVQNILPTEVKAVDKVIIPSRGGEIITGSGEGLEEKKIIPRTKYLIEVLSELGLAYRVETGTLDEHMFRQKGYQIFVVPEKKKLVFVNNEEGYATRVVHGFRNTDSEDAFGVTDGDIVDYLSDLNVDELDSDESVIIEKINYPGSPDVYKQKVTTSILLEVTPDNSEMLYKTHSTTHDASPSTKKEREKNEYDKAPGGVDDYKGIVSFITKELHLVYT